LACWGCIGVILASVCPCCRVIVVVLEVGVFIPNENALLPICGFLRNLPCILLQRGPILSWKRGFILSWQSCWVLQQSSLLLSSQGCIISW
jgi:hypothetical protein